MGQRYKNLFPSIIAMDNLRAAFNLTWRGKRNTLAYLQYKEQAEVNLLTLQDAFASGSYVPAPPREFVIFEPKPRQISALSFSDRVAQHALCRIIGPIFERVLMSRCYACRVGMGTHYGARRVQAEMRRLLRDNGDLYFLKTDFKQYFASINRARLWVEIERKISCKPTLALIERFLPRTGQGLPIGNLTSQLFANLYGHIFDRWLVAQGALRWHRYMDDVVVLGGAQWKPMVELLRKAEEFAAQEMGLRLSRWMVAHYSKGVNFLGYRIWPTHKLLRRSSVVRAKRKLRCFAKHNDTEGLQRFTASWMGHASWADSHNLLTSLNLKPAA